MMSIFFNRLWLAAGGYSTLYFSTFSAYAAVMHAATFNPSIFSSCPIPKPLLAPTVFTASVLVGVHTLGDRQEFFHLLRNYGRYRSEFKMIRKELYYS